MGNNAFYRRPVNTVFIMETKRRGTVKTLLVAGALLASHAGVYSLANGSGKRVQKQSAASQMASIRKENNSVERENARLKNRLDEANGIARREIAIHRSAGIRMTEARNRFWDILQQHAVGNSNIQKQLKAVPEEFKPLPPGHQKQQVRTERT